MTLPLRGRLAAGLALAFAALAPRLAGAQSAPAKTRAVFQVSDADPQKWQLTLGNVRNAQEALGRDASEIEIVAYGPGIDMLRKGSAVADKVGEALRAGVRVLGCQNTMRARQLTPVDMLPDIGFVPSGVVEIMQRQQAGWAYLRS